MKKISAIILSLVMIICMMPSMVFASAPDWFNPETKEYLITSTDMIKELSLGVNDGSIDTEGVIFKLQNNLDFSTIDSWEGIGNDSHPFKGKFDGQGYSIMGLNSTLFGTVSGGTVKDIKFVTPLSVSGPVVINRINDTNPSYSTVESISVNRNTASLNTVINGNAGLIGSIVNDSKINISDPFEETSIRTKIAKCSNSVDVESLNGLAGGIVGSIEGAVLLSGNSNAAKVSAIGDDPVAGGIVGKANGIILSKNSMNVNTGSVTSYVSKERVGGTAGGIAGYASNSAFQFINNSGAINADIKGNYIGVGLGKNNLYALADNGILPVAGLWKSTVNAQSMSFSKDYAISGSCSIQLKSSSIYNIVPLTDNSSIVIQGGAVSSISTKEFSSEVTASDATINNILATDRTKGHITLNTNGSGIIHNVTAGSVKIGNNSGKIGNITVSNDFAITLGTNLPEVLIKYGSDINYNSIFSGIAYDKVVYNYNPTYYKYTVKYGALIGNIKYATLADAFANAKNLDTITVLEDSHNMIEQTIPSGKNITLDLNGHKITVINGSFVVNGNLTIKDSTNGNGLLKTISTPKVDKNNGKLTIRSGAFSFPVYEFLLNTSTATYSTYTKLFTVKDDMKIDGCSVTLSEDYFTYDGKEKRPTVSIKDGTINLINGIDYTVSYYSNINAGKASLIIFGKGKYTGSKRIDFTIYGANITSLKMNPIENQGFTGTYIKPTLEIFNGTSKLVENVDYYTVISNNISKGTALVTIYGKGNYSGTRVEKFKIAEPINEDNISKLEKNYRYTGYKITPSVTVLGLRENIDYKLSYGENIKAGIGIINVIGIGNYGGSYTLRFNIIGENQVINSRWNKYSKRLTSEKFNLGAYALGGATVYFTSLDPNVVNVDYSGYVTIKNTGIARIKIFTEAVGAYPATEKTVTVTVKPNKAVISRAYSPASGKLKVAIKKAPGVTKYQVKYGRNGSYKNFYYKYSTNPNYMTQAKTFKGLDNGKAYFVKVRAYKTMDDGTKVWGNWSKTRKVYVR